MSTIIGFILSIALLYYFYIFMESNSYFKNVGIYAIVTFFFNIITSLIDHSSINFFSLIITCLIIAFIEVKIMEFVKARVQSPISFIIWTDLCMFALGFVLGFVANLLFRI